MECKNVITRVGTYGLEPRISFRVEQTRRIHGFYTHNYFTFYFKGVKPRHDQLILVKNIHNFSKQTEGNLCYLTSDMWAAPTIEDFLDLQTSVEVYDFHPGDFTSKEFLNFFEKHLKEYADYVRLFLANVEVGDKDSLLTYKALLSKFSSMFLLRSTKQEPVFGGKIPSKSVENLAEIETKMGLAKRYEFVIRSSMAMFELILKEKIGNAYYLNEKNILNEIDKYSAEELLEKLNKLKSYTVKFQAELKFLEKITDKNNRILPKFFNLLPDILKIGGSFNYSKLRWTLPSNAKGLTIDISKAVVRKASLKECFEATRIGNISNNNKVLVLRSLERNGKTIYIKGGKSLKMQVKESGGQLKKFDNILTIGDGTIYSQLLQIEKINFLSVLNPELVIDLLKENKKDTKSLEKLVPKIKENFFESKKLADTAVELIYNLDPKTAKRLIKIFAV